MKYLGLDYGKKWVGVAMSDGTYATGLVSYHHNEALVQIRRLCEKERFDICVIGLGSASLHGEIKAFGEALAKECAIQIVYQDETLTTQTAQTLLQATGKSRKVRHENEHQTAAALLLQSYLDHHNQATPTSG